MKTVKCGFLILFFLIFLFPRQTGALTSLDKYPRIANYYLVSQIKKDDYDKLAKYDLIILPMEAQAFDQPLFEYLRKKNPDIVILPYIPSQSIDRTYRDVWPYLRQKLYSGVEKDWWLYDQWGNKISYPVNADAVNVNTDWNNYLPRFVKEEILSTGLWDGIFYDMVDSSISYCNEGNIDLNQDKEKDELIKMDKDWCQGVTKLLKNTRDLIGKDKLIIINGNSYDAYQPYVNGRMFESFPTPWEGQGNWLDSIKSYLNLPVKNFFPPVHILNADTNNTGDKNSYSKMRFGLTSALLGDGYFGFDYGTKNHSQLWWYDEYEVYLNQPLSHPYDLLHNNSDYLREGVWRRDFKNGMVLINSTSQQQKIKLEADYEKINGQQDKKYNDGSIINTLDLNSQDGIILLRPIKEIIGDVFTNGSFARVFDSRGKVLRNAFFAYLSDYESDSNIITQDINNDFQSETIVATKNQINIFNAKGKKINSFYPYGQYYNQGINLAVGDLDNNGTLEIVTGTEAGGPQVKIFNYEGKLINPGFFAFDRGFRGGVKVAVGDLNGDDWREIIVGAGAGGGPQVRVFGIDGRLINPGFFAFDIAFRGGVNVAAGDLDNNGVDEIIVGAGIGGGPQVRVFNKDGKLINPGFFAFDQNNRSGVKVIANDLNNDGQDEIIAATTDVFPFLK